MTKDPQEALGREWLETNGLGGFASGTVGGANTRRYHGLLVAALNPPVDRRVLFSKADETFTYHDQHYDLGCNIYSDVTNPTGYQYLEEFRLDPWPVWVYRAGPCVFEKQVLMLHGRNTTLLGYRLLEAPEPAVMYSRLFVATRDYHHLSLAHADFNTYLHRDAPAFMLQPYEEWSRLWLRMDSADFHPDGIWYYALNYPRERERGLDYIEDLYSPGTISCALTVGRQAWVVISHDEPTDINPPALVEAERERRAQIADRAGSEDSVKRRLFLAADQFIVSREQGGRSVIAGYPWFTDWGRDAMIALPALTLLTGRPEDYREILGTFASHISQGLVPNTFGDATGSPMYNTVDAALWMFTGVWRYLESTGDLDFIKDRLYDTLCDSIDWHLRGTQFGIKADADGLLNAGAADTQLTWMDARTNNVVFTPRHGKAVEINALWCNALRICQELSTRLGQPEKARQLKALADTAQTSFADAFWSPEHSYLYDCIHDGYGDASLRPNQVIALALPFELVAQWQAGAVLEQVDRALLTPYGLRTLAPGNEGYRGRYEGDQFSRDSAYHQGTVWPWLISPYLRARSRVYGAEPTRAWAREYFAPLLEDLERFGVGSVAEVYDGDAPHRPGGCIAQAWSVAAALELVCD